MAVKRYNVSSSVRKIPLGNGQTVSGIGMGTKSVESEHGDWVKFEDYETLRLELKAVLKTRLDTGVKDE